MAESSWVWGHEGVQGVLEGAEGQYVLQQRAQSQWHEGSPTGTALRHAEGRTSLERFVLG